MRVEPQDLENAFQGQKGKFEDFVHELVLEAVRNCGINPNRVQWDHRTDVPDGGRDIVVEEGVFPGADPFIPARPSVWSVKSGADGTDPDKFKKEVLPQQKKDHPKVREALKRGHTYVWCAVKAVTVDGRDRMQKAAEEVAAKLSADTAQFEFRWLDQLVDQVNRFPNVIPPHLPDIQNRWNGVRTLEEWRRLHDLGTPWAEFGHRAALVRQVADHLLGRGAPNVLHLAGLSGVGKTRLVFEACQTYAELSGVFYLPRSDGLGLGLERALRGTARVLVVIDETPLGEIDGIARRFADCTDRVRLVTVGPASRQRATAHRDIIVVPEPETESGVLSVIHALGSDLPEDVLRSIAHQSGHDLRLALRLVEATVQQPSLQTLPLVGIDDMWRRLMGLFPDQIRDPSDFRQRYEALTVATDVGFGEEQREELLRLAEYFGHSEVDLLDCLNVAATCGLGLRAGRFFEATPRALAAGLFADLFQRRLRDRLDEFVRRLPPRLLRRFLERCQECPDDIREEVADAVGRVFLGWLGGPDVTALSTCEASRVFQAWAEFDPDRGLRWLRRAVDEATPDQLRALDGESDGPGGWRGRRQVVWLCQNLACFAEHFDACEAVLCRLARHETEPEIGNNSTAVWQSLFWPILSHTEVPFWNRFAVLLGRLRAATADDLLVVLGAAFAAVESRTVGLPVPTRVVGGRVVPAPWMPATHGQLLDDRRGAAGRILGVIAELPAQVREPARREVVRQLRRLGYLGLIGAARELFPPTDLPADLRRELVVELDHLIGFERWTGREGGRPVRPHVPGLEEWRAELTAGDLAVRVQDLTARDFHDVWLEERTDDAYARLADELIAAPDVLRALGDWFAGDAAKGAGPFGFCLGRRDTGDRLADPIREWLTTDRCRPLAVGYLNGAARRDGGGLPAGWAAALDAVAEVNPELAALATATADVSDHGLDRILGVLGRLPAPASRFLRSLAYNEWGGRLGVGGQLRVLDALLGLADAGDRPAAEAGVNLLRFWWHDRGPLDPQLVPAAFRLAALAPATASRDGGHGWRETLRELCPHDPVRVAGVVVGVMTGPDSAWRFDDDNVRLLAGAARLDPDGVMEAIGRAILDPDRRGMFAVDVFEGLFEAIGLDAVRRWVGRHGPDTLKWVARHLASPSLDAAGEVAVPPLTGWLFTDREGDQEAFEWFLMGRRSAAGWWTAERAKARPAELAPFLTHPLRRVREWAQYEVESAEREAAWFRRYDEEAGRL